MTAMVARRQAQRQAVRAGNAAIAQQSARRPGVAHRGEEKREGRNASVSRRGVTRPAVYAYRAPPPRRTGPRPGKPQRPDPVCEEEGAVTRGGAAAQIEPFNGGGGGRRRRRGGGERGTGARAGATDRAGRSHRRWCHAMNRLHRLRVTLLLNPPPARGKRGFGRSVARRAAREPAPVFPARDEAQLEAAPPSPLPAFAAAAGCFAPAGGARAPGRHMEGGLQIILYMEGGLPTFLYMEGGLQTLLHGFLESARLVCCRRCPRARLRPLAP